MSDRSSKDRLDQDRKLDSAKDYINRMQIERSDIEKRFHAMKEDLLTRLQNACTQRDEARAQVSVAKGRGQGAASSGPGTRMGVPR